MTDRRGLQQELNRINQLYQEYDLQLSKAGASTEQRNQLRAMMNQKKEELIAQMGDSLQNLNIGKSVNLKDGTITKAGKDLLGGGLDVSSIRKTGVIKGVGKKLLGAIPLAGIGMAIADSPAASASDLIQDPKVQRAAFSELAGPVGDAIDITGDIAEYGLDQYRDFQDQAGMNQAEIQAKKNYANSPGRLAKLQSLMGRSVVREGEMFPGRSPAASSSKDAQQLEDEAAMNDPYMKKPRIDDSEEKLRAYSKVAKPLKERTERLKKKQD